MAEALSTLSRNWVKKWILEWPSWWAEQSLAQKTLPLAAVSLYWLILLAIQGFRGDHVAFGAAVLALSYGGRPARVLMGFFLPSILTAAIYDSQRFWSDYVRGPIHVTEPYDFDKRFFGIPSPQGVLTPNEWWELHTHPALDLVTGFFYLTFITIFVLIAAYFYFYSSRKGTSTQSAFAVAKKAPALMWSFFWVNMVGFSTYYWYAAAPPWYVTLYGLGPANMDARPNPAGCIRFDQLLGTRFFSEMYGRSADVFGAIPSLHVAYPLIAVYFAFRFGAVRAFSVFFYLIMCFSAVYLNHHYVIDVLLGSLYAIITAVILDWYYGSRKV